LREELGLCKIQFPWLLDELFEKGKLDNVRMPREILRILEFGEQK
jgi:hypothetical protein